MELSQVYLPENLKDIEQRLIQVESDNRKHEEERAKERLKNVEDAIKEIPSDLIENWNEVITRIQKMHQEDKERKEAVQAIWKRLDILQDYIKMKALEEDVEMKGKILDDMKDLYQQIQNVEHQGTERGGHDGEKSKRIDWEQRMKRADFNKPENEWIRLTHIKDLRQV